MLNTIKKLAGGERAFIVCIGDSITEQNYHLQGKLNYVGQLTERLMELYSRRSRVLNAGTSGDTTSGLLQRIERDAIRFKPDLVTVMIGMNDAEKGLSYVGEFKRNLDQIICRIVESGSEALLLTQNGLDFNINEEAVNSRTSYPAFAAAIREVASAAGVPLCDIYHKWDQHIQGNTNAHLMLMHDSIHPGELGHAFMAAELFEYLNISSTES